jgi:hypothetical protein
MSISTMSGELEGTQPGFETELHLTKCNTLTNTSCRKDSTGSLSFDQAETGRLQCPQIDPLPQHGDAKHLLDENYLLEDFE